jgi:hypothetical protein
MRVVHDIASQQGYDGIAAEALVVQGAAILRMAEPDRDAALACLKEGHAQAMNLGAIPLAEWAGQLLGRSPEPAGCTDD